MKDYKNGITVSHNNGEIDWSKASVGIAFAWIKATEGATYVDPKLHDNVSGARSNDIKIGAYHIFRANIAPDMQCDNFFKNVAMVDDITVAIVLGDLSAQGEGSKVFATRLAELAKLFTQKVGGKKARICIQTNKGTWEKNIESFAGYKELNFDEYPLWVANYTDSAEPKIPQTWNDWTYWQYSNTGKVAGIKADVLLERNKS